MTDQEITARPIGANVRDDQHDEPPPASGSNELDETDASSGDGDSGGKPELDDRMKKMYWRFGAMIATSTVAMFVLMYFNTYEWDHVEWSETRFYMAFVMGSTMAVIMLLFMLGMYKSKIVNAAILGTSVVIFAFTLFLVRSQTTVQDTSYMRAMIPHHSIAILTSERSELTDLRVLELADEIILAQRREIDEMQGQGTDGLRAGESVSSDQSVQGELDRVMGLDERQRHGDRDRDPDRSSANHGGRCRRVDQGTCSRGHAMGGDPQSGRNRRVRKGNLRNGACRGASVRTGVSYRFLVGPPLEMEPQLVRGRFHHRHRCVHQQGQ